MSIAVTGGTLKAGYAFTVAGVYAMHHTKKTLPPCLKTFRVIKVEGSIVIYCPPIISEGPYQNVSAPGAVGAEVKILNTTDQAPGIFWRKNSVELIRGNVNGLNNLQGGARFMKAATKSWGCRSPCCTGWRARTWFTP
ncbi:P22 phage major capsid protein family protein [Enterobacter mori]|uniref:P22 phage major capsid protein family protein n=1 Tax=Enterobacter mori TaxID=539813 RepID=UPI003B8439E9